MTEDPWMAAMMRGDFEGAWRISDRVLAVRLARGSDSAQAPRHEQPVWDGRPLTDAHVLVRCHHGLGDTLQFVRLLAPCHARARSVTLKCQRELVPLLRDVRGADRVVALEAGDPPFDVDIEVMELPHALRLTSTDLPGRVPYVFAPATTSSRDLHEPIRVGVSWRAGTWNEARSIDDPALAPLGRIAGVNWCSIQRPQRPLPFPARDASVADPTRLAGLLGTFDLVISVDTFPAHLAGALGIRVWTLLPAQADWRWMRERCDSPWYPTMRLFRQTRAGDWADVIERVAAELRALLRPPRSAP